MLITQKPLLLLCLSEILYFQSKFSIEAPIAFQDTIHISTKIKTRLLKPNVVLPMGSYFISKEHLSKLIKEESKDKHLLNLSDLEGMYFSNYVRVIEQWRTHQEGFPPLWMCATP